VFSNDYRNPVILAKECATLDVLSEGRLELGLGAGWDVTDYDHAGIGFDKPGLRIDRFVETLEILQRCFALEPFSFFGNHYTVADYDAQPKPLQRPSPPILIGGGAKRMLGIAGQEADIVSVNFDLSTLADRSKPIIPGQRFSTPDVAATGTAAMVDQKLQWIREGAGARFDKIELHINAFMTIFTEDSQTDAERLAGQLQISPKDVMELPFALIGTVEQMIDTLIERRERYAINYVTFPMMVIPNAYARLAPLIERLART
jgi:probable F420-dependent oxidoreductase